MANMTSRKDGNEHGLIIVILILIFGGGGGYYAHCRDGGAGLGGVLGTVLIILIVLWIVGGI